MPLVWRPGGVSPSGHGLYRAVQGTVWALIALSVALLAAEAMVPAGSPWRRALAALDRGVLWV